MPAKERRDRRSLTHVGGPVELWGGDASERSALARALDIRPDEGSRDHVHGFHSYPARMHPLTARRLTELFSPPRALVLDPFCGSGTVLVEARLTGRRAAGIDANPLAVELTWLKARGTTSQERAEILEGARAVARSAEERRRRRAGATHRYGAEDVALFDPHVLLELDGLRAAFRRDRRELVRRTLALVFSSILVKVSRQKADTSEGVVAKRLASGFTVRLFQSKAEELVRRLAEFASRLPRQALGPPVVRLGDARKLEGIASASVDLVVTSPPYPGTYDYLAHHALRLRWLDMDSEPFAEQEIGARRHLEHLPEPSARTRFASDLGAALGAMSRVLLPKGTIILVVADSVIRRRPLYADKLVREIATQAGLEITAIGSQARPHFHGPSASAFGRLPRREHVIVCRRGAE